MTFSISSTIRPAVAAAAALALCAAAPRATAEPAATPATPVTPATPATPARTRVALSQALAPLDGRHLRATMTEVNFAPGASSPAHSHPCPVMVYVLEGAIRSRVKGEREATYRAGETFYEAANGVHELAANASDQVPAKILAVSICDRDTPLTVPAAPAGGK